MEWRRSCPAGPIGYHKEALAFGQQTEHLDLSMFISNVGEDGFIRNSNYKTQTLNFNLRFKIDDKQNFYFKAITNWLDAQASLLGSPKDNSTPTSDKLAGADNLHGRDL